MDISQNASCQQDHLERMKLDAAANQDYYEKIMAIRYPVYMDLLKEHKSSGKMLDIGAGFAEKWFKDYIRPAGFTYFCTDISDEVVSYMADLFQFRAKSFMPKKACWNACRGNLMRSMLFMGPTYWNTLLISNKHCPRFAGFSNLMECYCSRYHVVMMTNRLTSITENFTNGKKTLTPMTGRS